MALYRKPESDPGRQVLLMVEQKEEEEDKERRGRGETEVNKCIHHPCKYTA